MNALVSPMLFDRSEFSDAAFIHDTDSVDYLASRPDARLRPAHRWPISPFGELDLHYDSYERVMWSYMRPQGPPSFTRGLLADLAGAQHLIGEVFRDNHYERQPLLYYVLASKLDGIFSLGGHLSYFAECIRRRDRDALLAYGYACIRVLYTNAMAFHQPVITIALVQGDALGGGFEAALACDVIVAERRSKFGLPEILFNLFPGMGAYSFLSRRIGAAQAEKMILGGRLYSAEQLHELGLVQVLCEDGEGEQAVRQYINDNKRRHSAHTNIYNVRRKVNPLAFAELESVVQIWADTALEVQDSDLRRMERLVAAQNRRLNKIDDSGVMPLKARAHP